MFLPQLIQDAALDGFQVTTYIIYEKNYLNLNKHKNMIGITFLPKQDVLLGVHVDFLNYEERGKSIEATRISLGLIFVKLSLIIEHK